MDSSFGQGTCKGIRCHISLLVYFINRSTVKVCYALRSNMKINYTKMKHHDKLLRCTSILIKQHASNWAVMWQSDLCEVLPPLKVTMSVSSSPMFKRIQQCLPRITIVIQSLDQNWPDMLVSGPQQKWCLERTWWGLNGFPTITLP